MTGRRVKAPAQRKLKSSNLRGCKENNPDADPELRNKAQQAEARARVGYVPLTLTAVPGVSDTSCLEKQLRRTSISVQQVYTHTVCKPSAVLGQDNH